MDGGVLTAAVASQISDGAAAPLIASQDTVDRFNLMHRARIHHMSVRGADPVMMLTAPIAAIQQDARESSLPAGPAPRLQNRNLNSATTPAN